VVHEADAVQSPLTSFCLRPMFSRHLSLVALAAFALAGCGSTPVAPPPAPVAAVVQPPPLRKVKIGLALGGGAARGFAHIGVIKALEAQGIVPDIVVGTSAGSVVGALYAAGNNGFALQHTAMDMDEAAISDWAMPFFSKVSGVLKGDALQNYVNKAVGNVPIERLKMPFGAVATDLNTGKPILFRRGNTGQAVRASSAVPSVFQPVKIGTHSYVDGGLVAPVPVKFAKDMGAEFVIAVNISTQTEAQAAASSLEVLMQTFSIMGQRLNFFELKEADIVIAPALGAMGSSDFAGRNRAILAGEQAAAAMMPQIKAKLLAKQQSSPP
jgi:NTE family protein